MQKRISVLTMLSVVWALSLWDRVFAAATSTPVDSAVERPVENCRGTVGC